jgi:hypothetical protein
MQQQQLQNQRQMLQQHRPLNCTSNQVGQYTYSNCQ